jgi:hypothetical protein
MSFVAAGSLLTRIEGKELNDDRQGPGGGAAPSFSSPDAVATPWAEARHPGCVLTTGCNAIGEGLDLVLGTADPTGQPWVSPAYFAAADYREFFWVTSSEAGHSRNIAAPPQERRRLRLRGTHRHRSGRVHVGPRRASDGRRPSSGGSTSSRGDPWPRRLGLDAG